jgi:hypothetical protein
MQNVNNNVAKNHFEFFLKPVFISNKFRLFDRCKNDSCAIQNIIFNNY